MKKRYIVFSLILIFILVGCGGSAEEAEPTTESTEAITTETTTDPSTDVEDESGPLVATTEESSESDSETINMADGAVLDLDIFDSAALVQDPTVVDCTLRDGTETECAQIVVKYLPDTLQIGPFCPDNIFEDAGGVWEWDGDNAGTYRLNEAFFTMLTEQGFNFYDEEGNVYVGDPGGGGLVADVNNCLEAAQDDTVEMTAIIPLNPVMADSPTQLGTVAQVGIAIDGVPIFADAPSVLDRGHLPALDVCGGHVDPGGWYHWHATATDIESSYEHEGVDADCHLDQDSSALFAYAFDGYPIYGSAEPDGSIPIDLDDCGGHVGPTPEFPDGIYHYHASLEFPNLPTCLAGVSANNAFATTAQGGIGAQGGGPGGGPGGGGRGEGGGGRGGQQGGDRLDFAAAADALGVTEEALRDALGGPPPDVEAAAATLGVSVEVLEEALGGGATPEEGDQPATDDAAAPEETEDSAETDHEHGDDTHTHSSGLDIGLFFDGAITEDVAVVNCTLSDGTETMCYEITVAGYPVNHEIGPFCPETTSTDAADAGIWFDGNGIYDVDGAFILGLADLYSDDNWKLYNDDGTVNITDTPEAFDAAARPNVDPEYQNHCVAGQMEWLDNGEAVQTTVTIPINPVMADQPSSGGNWGITLNGVTIAAAAPVNAILGAYTIAVFDDCGGHINPVDGYHLHGARGCSEVGAALDGETPIFGYAMDGFPIYSALSDEEAATADLDECNGHFSEEIGYHYHANPAEENSVIGCFSGLTVGGAGGGRGAGGRGAGSPNEAEPVAETPPATEETPEEAPAEEAPTEQPAAEQPPANEGAAPPAEGENPPQEGDAAAPPPADAAPPQNGGQPGGEPDFAAAAEALGVTEQELVDALGGPPPDFAAAAEILGVTEEELRNALGDDAGAPPAGGGPPPGGGGRGGQGGG